MPETSRAPVDLGLCPHGRSPGECRESECLTERLRPEIDARARWQVEGMVGEIDGFAPGVDVGYAVGKKRRRERTERGHDMVLADKATGLLAIQDGLGGAGSGRDAGAEASAYASAMLPEAYLEASEHVDALARQGRLLVKADRAAHDQYRALPKDRREKVTYQDFLREWMAQPEEVRMEMIRLHSAAETLNADLLEILKGKGNGATTLVASKTIEADGRRYEVILTIGDSAAYRRAKDGRVEQVTEKDSASDLALELGLMNEYDLESPRALDALVEALRKRFGDSGITDDTVLAVCLRSLGSRDFRARVVAVPVESGDAIVLASDGLDKGFMRRGDPLERIDTERLGKALSIGPSLAQAAEELRDKAMANQVFLDDCVVAIKTYS